MIRMLSTSEFAKALGVSESSVRRLADAGDLEIQRTRGGHRRIPVEEAIRYVREQHIEVAYPEMLGLIVDAQPGESAQYEMLRVLRRGHAASVVRYVHSLYASGMSVAELCDGPIAFAFAQIGAAWPHDKRAIFIEHRALMLCQRALNQLHAAIGNPEPDAPEAIGGGVSGDVYMLPSLMVSLVVHELGFNETNLGPNMPIDVLTDCVFDEKPKLLWVTISEPINSRTRMREMMTLASAAAETNTTMLIGGRHAGSIDELSKTMEHSWQHCSSMMDLHRTARHLLET